MAMNPAAKDPNAFASSNLSGGGASSAILGVPQNPAIPRGAQPTSNPQTPLAQRNDASFGPQYWNTVSAQGGGQAAPDYASQIAAHNAQMLQQMQAEMQASTQAPATYYGIGPNNEVQIGDQVLPSDNLTALDQVMKSPVGQQSVTQSTLRPGFRPVTAQDVAQYVQQQAQQRGIGHTLGQIGYNATVGAPGTMAGLLGRGTQFLTGGESGAGLRQWGEDYAKATDTAVPDTLGHGPVSSALISGASQLAPIAATVAANTFGGPGSPLAVAADVGMGGLFGASAAQEQKEAALEGGASQADADSAAIKEFFLTGAVMGAMAPLSRFVRMGGYNGLAKLQQAVKGGQMTADQAAAIVTKPAFAARFLTGQAGDAAMQAGLMGGQQVGTNVIYNQATGDDRDVTQGVGDAALGGAAFSILTSPMAAVHQFKDSARRAELGRALSTPTEQVDLLNAVKMDQAAKAIQPEVGGFVGADAAKQFTADTAARSTDAYSNNLIAAERAARNETPGFGGQAPAAPVVPDAARQADVEAAFPPIQQTPEEIAAAKTERQAAKQAAKAQREQHELTATNALISIGVAQPTPKDVRAAADAVEAGIDITSPQAAGFREALMAKKYGLAKQRLAELQKGTNDSAQGLPRPGDTAVGGPTGGEPAGSVGAGKADTGNTGGDVRPSAGEPVASVQPTVAGGDAGVRPDAVKTPFRQQVEAEVAAGTRQWGDLLFTDAELAAKMNPNEGLPKAPVKAEIPDFSLEHPTGAPSAAWLAAHPEEARVEPKPTDNLSLRTQAETGQKTLFDPETKRKRVVKPTEAPRVAVAQGSALGPTTATPVEPVETATKAKQARKRQEIEAAAEAAKTPEQRAAEAAAEAAAKTTIPALDVFKKVWGAKIAEQLHAAANGENWASIAAKRGVDESAVRKTVERAQHEKIDKLFGQGTITADEMRGLHDALEIAKGSTAKRKTEAAIAKEGGDSSAFNTDVTEEQAKDLLQFEGVSVQGEGSKGVKSKAEVQAEGEQAKAIAAEQGKEEKPTAGRGADLDTVERSLLLEANKLDAEMRAAQKAGNTKRVGEIQEELKKLERLWKGRMDAPLKEEKADAKAERDIEAEIAELQNQQIDAEDAGDRKKAAAIEKELQKLYDERDRQMEQETGVETDAGGRMLDESQDPTERMRTSQGGGISDAELNPIIDKIVTALGGDRSMVQVHDTAEGMPPGSVAGRVDENGIVHLYRDGISSGLEGQKTLFHELFHSGLRKLGIEYHRVLNQLYRTNDRVRVLADKWIATPEGQKAKADYAAEYPNAPQNARAKLVSHATDEALARIAEELKTGTGLGTAARSGMVRAIAGWMAKLADSLGMTKLAQSIRSMTYTRVEKFVQEAIEASVSRRQLAGEGARNRIVDRNISKLPERYQEPARNITHSLGGWVDSAINKTIFTRDLVARGVARGMTALHKFDTFRESRDALAGHYQKMAYDAIEDVRKFSDPEKRALSDFLQQSTLDKQWGYGDKAAGKAKTMFEALSPRSQKVAQAIFAHGETILKEKQAAIQELADSLYKGMMDEAKAAGHTRILKDLQDEQAGFLKKYKTLMALDEGMPYVSLQRRGDFVAVGKSDAYLKAEAAANAEGATREDRAALEALQTDPNHYLVSSAQNEREAQLLRNNMRDAGFPATGDHTYYRPKSEWAKDGGGGVIAGMGRLRNQLDMMSRESANPADRARYASMNHLLTNMWLDALSQRSSRKAEMRRLGVHGTMDVVGSFREAAGADAHFISGIKFNDKMLTALKEARKQADRGEGEQRTANLNLMDEFLKRHEQSTNAVPTPWANKITKTVALWQIATSPAHYIGNLMQPWTMTLPYLQAKHGYADATNEFFKAYKEIGGILADTGLLKSLKVDDMPADVRDAMKRLLELGRLDIGMNTEYTSMELNIIPKNVVTKALDAAVDRITSASLKMESLNRLASAAAAYRLELKRTGSHEQALHYAGDVVAETHGDHSRANAPRAFNNGFGKVALQFRKFQLVQLTQMAKMIGNLKNADPAERAVALRMLAYTAAHVAALGGAIGMPGFNTFSAIHQNLQNMLTGIEGEDWETRIEKMVGDRHTAQLLLRGLPGLLGVDLTTKVGYGDMLGVSPYTDVNLADRQSVQTAMGQTTAGPFGGLVGRAAQSLHHMLVGNYYKGLEGLMPQGIANVMKGARELNEGVTNTKGDKLMNINAGEAMLEALGFQPSSKSMMQSETGAMIQSSEEFKSRLETLKERYTNTARSGGDVSSIVKSMNALRAEMIDRGYKPTPLGDLLKSPMQQLVRQLFTTPGGVQYKPAQTGRAVAQFPT